MYTLLFETVQFSNFNFYMVKLFYFIEDFLVLFLIQLLMAI